jgi:hypothetical protein
MEDTMDVIFISHKGEKKNLLTVEKYNIYQKTENGMQINDKSNIANNKIFDIIVKHDPQ